MWYEARQGMSAVGFGAQNDSVIPKRSSVYTGSGSAPILVTQAACVGARERT
jgi:hypothetical protein